MELITILFKEILEEEISIKIKNIDQITDSIIEVLNKEKEQDNIV